MQILHVTLHLTTLEILLEDIPPIFVLWKRQKEISNYRLKGMEKKTINKIFVMLSEIISLNIFYFFFCSVKLRNFESCESTREYALKTASHFIQYQNKIFGRQISCNPLNAGFMRARDKSTRQNFN